MEMKRGISPVVATVLLIAIAVIGSVTTWLWVSSYTGRPALVDTSLKSYTVIFVYRNSSSTGCDSIDIKNSGGSAINNLVLEVKYITNRSIAGKNSGWVNDANLVSYWNLNGNANDYKNLNNATVNIAVYNASAGFGGAYEFTGTNMPINISNSPSLNITGQLTISAWARTNVVDTSYDVIVARYNGSVNTYQIGFNGRNNKMYFGIYTQGGAYAEADSDNAPTIGTWYHIVGVMNSSSNMTLYVNGVAQPIVNYSVSGVAWNMGGMFTLGSIGGGIYNVQGTIDDVAIFNRSLSAIEVARLYYNGGYALGDVIDPVYVNITSALALGTTGNFNLSMRGNASYKLSVGPGSYVLRFSTISPTTVPFTDQIFTCT